MTVSSEPTRERFVTSSGRIILECNCGERLILLGHEDDWRSERTVFRCECGQSLTLAGNRLVEGVLGLEKLLGSFREEGPDLRNHPHQGP
jgi:hypothetical protein